MSIVKIRDVIARFPERVPLRARSTQEYSIEGDLFAWRGPLQGELMSYRLAQLDDEQITILRLPTEDLEVELPDQPITAVYSLQRKGPVFVPTGRIFVRLDRQLQAKDLSASFEELGFRVVEIPGYAPHAAWLEHESGEIHRALIELSRIQELDGVENVEPQMLTERALRAKSDK